MSRYKYIPDERSKLRKVRDAVYVTDPTPSELEADAKKLARQITRDLKKQVRVCNTSITNTRKAMRKAQERGDELELRRLAKITVQDEFAIKAIEKDIVDMKRTQMDITSHKISGAKAELLSIKSRLTSMLAKDLNPTRVAHQNQKMIKNQAIINVSEKHIKRSTGGLFRGDDAEVEELTEVEFQKACDRAGLRTQESFSRTTVVPTDSLTETTPSSSVQAYEDPDDAYIRERLARLNDTGGDGF